VYTVLAFIAFKNYPSLPYATVSVLVFKAALVGFMMTGNYLGGSLILKDRIALEELP